MRADGSEIKKGTLRSLPFDYQPNRYIKGAESQEDERRKGFEDGLYQRLQAM
jgi:hypothetical protein